MTSAGHLPGSSNPLSGLAKAIMALGALAVGLVVFAVSATFILFAALAIAVLGLATATFLWARARLTGRPFGPREHLEAMLSQMQPQMQAQPVRFDTDGPVVDMRRTPDGWSVDP